MTNRDSLWKVSFGDHAMICNEINVISLSNKIEKTVMQKSNKTGVFLCMLIDGDLAQAFERMTVEQLAKISV